MLLLVSSFLPNALVPHLLVGARPEPFVLTAIGVCLILVGNFVRKRESRSRTQNLRNPKSSEITKTGSFSRARETNSRPSPGADLPIFIPEAWNLEPPGNPDNAANNR